MPISLGNPFKGRHHPGEVILSAVRWYLGVGEQRNRKPV